MSTHYEGRNKKRCTCRDCGASLEPGAGVEYAKYGYPWDGSDEEGSITVKLSSYALCYNATECAERVVANGTNIAALKMVARDHENCNAELRAQAAAILNQYRQLAHEQAVAADLAARESGYGVIGGRRA